MILKNKEAYAVVKQLEKKSERDNGYKYISNIEIYNQLLFDLASQATSLKDITYFFKLFREKNLNPNIHSYSACLIAIYRIAENRRKFDATTILQIQRILNDIDKMVN